MSHPHSLAETTHPPTSVLWRLAAAIWRQGARTRRCPETPRLEGRLALVTGGNAGVGFETSLGLARRGAHVVIAARREREGQAAAARVTSETGGTASFVPLDLADLSSAKTFGERLGRLLRGRGVDLVIANAGLWPRADGRSRQGHELAFATNVLGHHAVVDGLRRAGTLDRARIVVVTGDIYVMAREVSADFQFSGTAGGREAYCRSKLGNHWWAHELARRFPALEVVTVHPGVIASGLGGGAGAFGERLRHAMMISCELGAQTSLWAATQPGLAGKYLHNTLGRVTLRHDDTAMNHRAAAALWDTLEQLTA
ncbi:MAG: SDR family NAD(P)-dependent oxidoreductase [Myxococcales bacterium]|nr:SDR family NAD(P)-dependent oxidoreductase [Myxococcales bacterium]